jgi:UV DNA damage endonuclease
MLGICCHYLKEETNSRNGSVKLVNEMEERVLQLGRYRGGKYTEDQIKGTYINNVKRLAEMLPKIYRSGVKLFRISSALFPLADQVDRKLWDNPEVVSHLKAAGAFVRAKGMRVTTHPGQFCVISSDTDSIIEKAFVELETHAWMFDAMGLDHSPMYAINIHGGKAGRVSKLIQQINRLPDGVRKRLTLENDENCYSVVDLLQVYQETGTPIVFDSHHFVFNDGHLGMDEAFEAAVATWPSGINPLQHISNTQPGMENGSFADRRKHSDMIHYVPDCQLHGLRNNSIDVEVEAKLKNVSVFKMAQDFSIPL